MSGDSEVLGMGEKEGEEASIPPSFFSPSEKGPNKRSEQRPLWICEQGRWCGQLAGMLGICSEC